MLNTIGLVKLFVFYLKLYVSKKILCWLFYRVCDNIHEVGDPRLDMPYKYGFQRKLPFFQIECKERLNLLKYPLSLAAY